MRYFADKILAWSDEVDRPMPWREEKNPYKIWISEIILQQTRVSQGLNYYLRFIDRFPNIESLASANIEEVLVLWEGLGYYSRARNLHHTAQILQNVYGGKFPKNHDEIIKLKGIGKYTAAAIASFAFELPYPVVDGNVLRVISRYLQITTPVDNIQTQKEILLQLQSIIHQVSPSKFNQAIMDFGALQCVPQKPNCEVCPINTNCLAFQNEMVEQLPIKEKKIIKKNRFFIFEFVHDSESFLVEKRTGKDIWNGLYQLPLKEFDSQVSFDDFANNAENRSKISKKYRQLLTHQILNVRFLFSEKNLNSEIKFDKIKISDRKKIAFPKVINTFFDDYSNNLNIFE